MKIKRRRRPKPKTTEREFPALVAGRVRSDTKSVVQTVMERTKWSESQLIRQLVHLDPDTVEYMREAWRERGAQPA